MSQVPKSPSLCSISEEVYCGTHLQPLQLFCEDDQITVCSKCVQSPEHMQHVVYGIQEASEYYRKLLQETLVMMRGKLEATKSLLADEQERMAMIQEEEQRFKEMIGAEYKMRVLLLTEQMALPSLRPSACTFDPDLEEACANQLRTFSTELKYKSQEMLQRLSHLGRENMNKLKTSEACAYKYLCRLQETITELEKKCGESAITLLQNAKHCLERSECLLLQSLKPAHITDLSSCLLIKMEKALLRLQRDITLDRGTAHPSLVLSEDLRSMGFGDLPQSAPDTPGRFDFSASVLGAESFSSGRHYWEVAVGQATQWQLGICDCTEKNSNIPQASGDKFLLMGSMMGTDYTFWVFPPLRKVCLRTPMYKVGVFLDYVCGQVSFYNVTEQSLIYNFCDLTFQGAVKPIFSLCIPNGDVSSDSLTVCLPQIHS
ncbi:probable E3 ubiquitin-protein ligase TRIML2 [Phodopus roborovskii]|uniref:Triml2 protein n=1 Tax=Phodopus roborovskii TaxID=109678 RepID=A0AAU9Z4W2_PHORO|nr:probable E3 ubiquitin-protein ligase TRIML2 [Phodopus roborovskii]CAH6787246.1 Triml2 [Phodopus roborovskii]